MLYDDEPTDPADAALLQQTGSAVGDLVQRALTAEGITWPLTAEFDHRGVFLSLTRGGLIIPADFQRWPRWWAGGWERAKLVAADLAALLIGQQRLYQDADPDGYRIIEMEMDGCLELLRLSPGVRLGHVNGGSMLLFHRLGTIPPGVTDFRAFTLGPAIAADWVRIL